MRLTGGLPSRSLRWEYGALQLANHVFGRTKLDPKRSARRRDLLSRILDDLRREGPRHPVAVPRRRGLSLSEFRREFQAPGIPVVLEGAALDWPCIHSWSFERLRRECGDDLLPIDHGFGRLGPLLEAIEGGSDRYLRFYSLLQRHPEYLKDLDLRFLRERKNPGLSLDQGFQTFIGNSKARPTALHNANDGNLFVQVMGKKEWHLYPSSHTFAIDPPPVRGEYRTQRFGNEFDPFAPDFDRFPLFQYIPSWETTLQPGDVLWNPPYVWHAVKNLTDPTIGVGYRWVSPTQCFALEPLYAAMDCLATSPPIWKSVQLSEQDFSLVFLEQFPMLKQHPCYDDYLRQIQGSYRAYRAELANLSAPPTDQARIMSCLG